MIFNSGKEKCSAPKTIIIEEDIVSKKELSKKKNSKRWANY